MAKFDYLLNSVKSRNWEVPKILSTPNDGFNPYMELWSKGKKEDAKLPLDGSRRTRSVHGGNPSSELQ